MKLAEKNGYGVFLGGGEPTDHPNFIEFLINILSSDKIEMETSGCITNGSNEKEALLLSNLSSIIYTALSVTQYHNSYLVSEKVKRAYCGERKRTFIREPGKTGRGKNFSNSIERCVCSDLFLDSNGNLYHCICKKIKYGNILTGYFIPEDALIGECSKDIREKIKNEIQYC